MKRFGNLFEKICDIDNLKLAHRKARKNKSFYTEVKMVNSNEDYYLGLIRDSLVKNTYKTSEYEKFIKIDQNKESEIYKLPYYPDRIVQWAILQIIEPILKNKMINDTYSAIPNKGLHYGLKRVKKALKDINNTKYCLKFDIKKYYPSINHKLLKNKYAKIFKDYKLLYLIYEIIDSVEMSENTGIPIGNYLSQWSANIFLCDFDHWLKEVKKQKYVFRYMDDIVILGATKEELHELLKDIVEYFKSIKLTIKSNYQVFPIDDRGIDFLGYRVFRNFVLLRKSICKRFKRKMSLMCLKLNNREKLNKNDICSIRSYEGWLKWCDSSRLIAKYMEGLVNK